MAGCATGDPEGLGQGEDELGDALQMPVHVAATASAVGCENSPGPVVTLNGELSMGGLNARLIFRNNTRGTHEHVEESKLDLVLVPKDQSIQIPKQPSQGGSGGNPFIWVQFLDGAGNALTGEHFLGRCVQGLSPLAADFSHPIAADTNVQATGCTNNPGPTIRMNGTISFDGLIARIIFRNNDNPVGGPHETVVTTKADVTVIPPGYTIQFAKQPVLGGVGGNPWIYLQFTDGSGQPLADETLLGRCVQLSKSI